MSIQILNSAWCIKLEVDISMENISSLNKNGLRGHKIWQEPLKVHWKCHIFLFCFTILAALAALKLSLAQFWADYADSKHFNFGCHSHYERLRDFDTKMFQLFYTRNGAEKVNKITEKRVSCQIFWPWRLLYLKCKSIPEASIYLLLNAPGRIQDLNWL